MPRTEASRLYTPAPTVARSGSGEASGPSRSFRQFRACVALFAHILVVSQQLASHRRRPLAVDQHAAQDLARGRLGNLVDDLDGADLLVGGHALGDERADLP